MSKEAQKSNFELAQEEANKIDLQIIDTLQKGYNFRVEAGAGSGKTYSLNKVIEWIQVNKWKQYRKKNQHVVCITYTNAAVDVISGRLTNDSCRLYESACLRTPMHKFHGQTQFHKDGLT